MARRLALVLLAVGAAGHSLAADSETWTGGATYYEDALANTSQETLERGAPGLPAHFHVDTSPAGECRYQHDDGDAWTITCTGLSRRHESVLANTIVGTLAIASLPAQADGTDAFEGAARFEVLTGPVEDPQPFVYRDAPVTLYRNAALEAAILPFLEAQGTLPPAGAGLKWVLFSDVRQGDAEFTGPIEVWGRLHYSAPASAGFPDPDDPASRVYVATWIPRLAGSVVSYLFFLDVTP